MKRIDYILDGIGLTFTLSQTEELLRVISIILTTIATLCSLAFSLYNWYKSAKSDGHITKEEIRDAGDIINGHLNTLNDDIKKKDKEE